MSAYTTLNITKEDALAEIFKAMLTANDDQIADTLFALVGNEKLYNYCIVSRYSDDDGLNFRRC